MKAEVWNITNLRCGECRALLHLKVGTEVPGQEWLECSNAACVEAGKRFKLPTIELTELSE